DPREGEEHGERRHDPEDLRAFAHRPDEEGFDVAGDVGDDEVHRDLREEDSEAVRAENECEDESARPRDDPGPEPLPREALDRGPQPERSFAHGAATAAAMMNVPFRRSRGSSGDERSIGKGRPAATSRPTAGLPGGGTDSGGSLKPL